MKHPAALNQAEVTQSHSVMQMQRAHATGFVYISSGVGHVKEDENIAEH